MPAIDFERPASSPHATPASAWARWAAVAILLVPSAAAVWVAAGLVDDVPWGDHLTLFRDTRILAGVTPASVLRFHNEHLIVPTRLAVAADYTLCGGTNLLPAACGLLLTLGILVIEAWMMRRAEPAAGPARAAFVTAVLAAILLNGRLTWTLTFPILLQHVSANACVVAALAAFATLAAGTAGRRGRAWAACLAAAGGAALSSASGVFALPAAAAATILLAAIAPAVRRGPWRSSTLAAGAVGMGIVAGYAAAYAAATSGRLRPPPDLVQAVRFAIYFPGGAWFRDSTWPIEHHPDPLLLHAVVLGFWLVVAGLAWRLWRRRDAVGEFEIFHASVIAFVVLTAAAGGLFRAGLGDLEALNKKYAPTALLAWASAASLLLRGGPSAATARGGVWPLVAACLATAAILPGDVLEFRAWTTWRDQTRAAAAAYAGGDRSDEVLLRFFPDAHEAERLLAPIAAARGYCFRRLSAAAAVEPPGTEPGRLARVPDHTDYALEFVNDRREPLGGPPVVITAGAAAVFRGWAVDREAGRPAAGLELLVGGRRFPGEYGLPRPDVAEHFDRPGYAASGFRVLLPEGTLPPGKHEVRLLILLASGANALETPPYTIVVEQDDGGSGRNRRTVP